ncbi:hypothetical protein CK625_09295 [Vandammella animalimorsus]|uniref:Alanine--tRNA ligase n=2 Tax=Vandammella animalimorsus TaxID=2029117 RepID=A0A2A2AEC4_9BURK|nr:hypothetical protein CK625_09295 [Vandammella animalimorsus]
MEILDWETSEAKTIENWLHSEGYKKVNFQPGHDVLGGIWYEAFEKDGYTQLALFLTSDVDEERALSLFGENGLAKESFSRWGQYETLLPLRKDLLVITGSKIESNVRNLFAKFQASNSEKVQLKELPDSVFNQSKVLHGEVAFKLHDTHGFPLDLTQDVCRERGVTVDVAGFDAAMQHQKDTARAAGKFKMDKQLAYDGAPSRFTGYTSLNESATVLALYADGAPVQQLQAGQHGVVVLDVTPFYAESGGQVGDRGQITTASGALFDVQDTQKIKADVFGQHGVLASGSLKVGDAVQAAVNAELRAATTRNHSVTHLMHKALRETLGEHVQQKGSLVDEDKTRFDFVQNAPVTQEQLHRIEQLVNAEIVADAPTVIREMGIEDAKASGAMMLFGEKYGDVVRVVDIGESRELCGGTHVQRAGEIGLFKLVMEGGVAAGVRRVEAITGAKALAYVQQLETTVAQAARTLKAPLHELQAKLEQQLEHAKALEKEIAALKGKLASSQGDELAAQAIDVGGLKVLAAQLDGADAKTLRDTLDKLKDKLKSAAIVLAAVERTEGGAKVQLAAGVTKDSVGQLKAGELVNFVAQQVGGKGGGKPDMAMAGGTDAAALPAALQSVQGWVAEKLA